MNLNQLAVFLAVAEEQSVSRGAEALHISQPAVSKQVRELEKTLNVALFHRLSSGVQLTPAGSELLNYARRIFQLERDAENAMRELRGLERGKLTIGASATIGTYVLPQVCAAFRARFPHVSLQLEIENSEAIRRKVLANRLDVAFVEGAPEDGDSLLQSEAFRGDEMVVIAAPNYALASRDFICARDICESPIVVREAGSGTREVVEAALLAQGLQYEPLMELGNSEAIKRAVAQGAGLAWISRLAIESETQNGELVILDVQDLKIARALCRIKRRGQYETHAARAFWKLLKAQKYT